MHRFVTAGALMFALVSSAAADDPQTKTAEAKPAAKSTKAAPSGPQAVVLETSQGTIVIKLAEKDAPKTTANFKKLVREKFYDGTYFHRVIPGFMIQGGRSEERRVGKECSA